METDSTDDRIEGLEYAREDDVAISDCREPCEPMFVRASEHTMPSVQKGGIVK
jgi:hypothetical protein